MTITSDEAFVVGPLRTCRVPLAEATSFVAGGIRGQPTISPAQRSGLPIALPAQASAATVAQITAVVKKGYTQQIRARATLAGYKFIGTP